MSATLAGIVLDAPDPRALADFYRALLDLVERERSPEWVVLRRRGEDRPVLSFQRADGHAAPVWPGRPGEQQMQLHLDVLVDDLEAETKRACSLGAKLADFQPQQGVRVLLDPAGHPFCLFVAGG